MGKLYEVNQQLWWLENMGVDSETGEFLSPDELVQKIAEVQMDRLDVLEGICDIRNNCLADVDMLKAEERRLAERRKTLKKKAERLLEVIDRECDGQKTKLNRYTVSYRKTESVNITDRDVMMETLWRDHPEAVRVVDPEPDKTAIKKLLKDGVQLPGVSLEQKMSCSLK